MDWEIVKDAGPVPAKRSYRRSTPMKYPLDQLGVGDALDVFGPHFPRSGGRGSLLADNIQTVARAYSMRSGRQFAVRKQTYGMRVWRVE